MTGLRKQSKTSLHRTYSPPIDPAEDASALEMKKWDRFYMLYLNKVEKLEDELAMVYSIVWGQCSEAMRTKIRERDDFHDAHRASNPIKLLEIIKSVAHD